MPLKLIVDSLDGIDDASKALYVQKDGKYHLDVDGLPDTSTLEKTLKTVRAERENFERELKDIRNKFSGIKDPDQVRKLLEQIESDEEAALIASGKVSEVVQKRTEKHMAAMQAKVDAALAQEQAAIKKANVFTERVLKGQVAQEAMALEVFDKALDDVWLRAKAIFVLDDEGAAVAKDSKGEVILGKDGKTPFTINEWMTELKEKAPHLFKNVNSGGGTRKPRESGKSSEDALPARERLRIARERRT